MKTILKKLPPLNTDEEAESFLENEDLSEYDWSDAKRVQFTVRNQTEEARFDLPKELIFALKQKAKTLGLPYNQFITQVLRRAI